MDVNKAFLDLCVGAFEKKTGKPTNYAVDQYRRTQVKQNIINSNSVEVQQKIEISHAVHFAAYHEMADVPVSFSTLEEEFRTRLALVEDLQKRFHFMTNELKSAGLRTEE